MKLNYKKLILVLFVYILKFSILEAQSQSFLRTMYPHHLMGGYYQNIYAIFYRYHFRSNLSYEINYKQNNNFKRDYGINFINNKVYITEETLKYSPEVEFGYVYYLDKWNIFDEGFYVGISILKDETIKENQKNLYPTSIYVSSLITWDSFIERNNNKDYYILTELKEGERYGTKLKLGYRYIFEFSNIGLYIDFFGEVISFLPNYRFINIKYYSLEGNQYDLNEMNYISFIVNLTRSTSIKLPNVFLNNKFKYLKKEDMYNFKFLFGFAF